MKPLTNCPGCKSKLKSDYYNINYCYCNNKLCNIKFMVFFTLTPKEPVNWLKFNLGKYIVEYSVAFSKNQFRIRYQQDSYNSMIMTYPILDIDFDHLNFEEFYYNKIDKLVLFT